MSTFDTPRLDVCSCGITMRYMIENEHLFNVYMCLDAWNIENEHCKTDRTKDKEEMQPIQGLLYLIMQV